MKEIFRFLAIIFAMSFVLFLYIREQNEILILRRSIPLMEKEIRELEEGNLELIYQMDAGRNPKKLLKKSLQPEYGYLQYPEKGQVSTLSDPAP